MMMRRKPVILTRCVSDDVPHHWHVVVLQPTSESVGHQLLGQGASRTRPVVPTARSEARRHRPPWCRRPAVPRHRGAARPRGSARRRRHRNSRARSRADPSPCGSSRTPGSRGASPAARASSSAPRRNCPRAAARHRWWWRRRAEHVLENPLAAQHRCRAVGARRDHQEAALAEQPAPRIVGQRHAAELAAVDVGDAVVLRQPFVDEGVVSGQQVEDVTVFTHDAVEEELGLALERIAQRRRRNQGTRQGSARWFAGFACAATDRRSCGRSVGLRGRPASGAPARSSTAGLSQLSATRRDRAAHRPGCCSRGRTTAATRARYR